MERGGQLYGGLTLPNSVHNTELHKINCTLGKASLL